MIQKLINDYLLSKQQERSKRERSGKWSPSAFGRCFRYQYWNRKDEPITNPPDERLLRVFAVGFLCEDFVGSCLNGDFERQVKVENEDIFGYADFVSQDEVIDIKTQHSKGFWYMDKEGFNINKEKTTHILQVTTYALLLGKPKARLVYISKDDLCIKEYGFFTNQWKDSISQELNILRWHWSQDELPAAKPRAYNGKECGFCSFRNKCKEVEDNAKNASGER